MDTLQAIALALVPSLDLACLPADRQLVVDDILAAGFREPVVPDGYTLDSRQLVLNAVGEDCADNTTRFLVIGREEVPPSGRDKTSIIVSSRNRPGALFALLDPFRRAGVSLTRIDTRPSRTEKWAYVFFIEFEGHLQDAAIAGILRELEEQSILLKPLGSYPRAVL